jgi:5-methylcytosine-specific restriction endonuclease McrA
MKKICKLCENEYKTTDYHRSRKFCSSKCFYLWNSGKNHPLYKIGHTQETKTKISENKERALKISNSLKDRKKTKEHIKKLVESRIKNGTNIPWNKGLKGEKYKSHYKNGGLTPPSNLGKKQTEFQKQRVKEIHTNKIVSLETKKKMSIAKQGVSLKDWKGFSSFEPYDEKFHEKFRRIIRKRDNQICMLCGIHREKLNKSLSIHHINYDKKLTIPENCLSLCYSCHSKTNHNRKHWISFFQSILSEKYGYEYENNQPIIKLEIIEQCPIQLNLKN